MENIIKFFNYKLVPLSQKIKKVGIEFNDLINSLNMNDRTS